MGANFLMVLCACVNCEAMTVALCAWYEVAVLCPQVKQVVMVAENMKVEGSSLGLGLLNVNLQET